MGGLDDASKPCRAEIKDSSKNPKRVGDKNFIANRFGGLSKLPKLSYLNKKIAE
jgi:hypothetical protein